MSNAADCSWLVFCQNATGIQTGIQNKNPPFLHPFGYTNEPAPRCVVYACRRICFEPDKLNQWFRYGKMTAVEVFQWTSGCIFLSVRIDILSWRFD